MTKKNLLPILLLSLAFSGTAYAHNPRMVESGAVTNIQDPEVSQAFYGILSGKPQQYFINTLDPIRLYAGLLVPDIPGATKDFSAEITQVGKFVNGAGQNASGEKVTGFAGKKTSLSTLDGTKTEWKRFYEEFGGDWYWRGPETAPIGSPTAASPAGLYEIKVSNPGNQGKYVLVVGDQEKFPPREIWNALLTMPHVKAFFGKSPYTAFFNRIGLFLFGPLILLVVAGLGVWLWIRKRNAEAEKGVKGLLRRIAKFLTKRRFHRE
jgi:hypothetical protein